MHKNPINLYAFEIKKWITQLICCSYFLYFNILNLCRGRCVKDKLNIQLLLSWETFRKCASENQIIYTILKVEAVMINLALNKLEFFSSSSHDNKDLLSELILNTLTDISVTCQLRFVTNYCEISWNATVLRKDVTAEVLIIFVY